MGQKNRHHGNKPRKPRAAHQPPALRSVAIAAEKKPAVVYGKPFIVLEDVEKDTFIYNGGRWTRHTRSIAECRQDSQVKELSQKINGMTRYEVCSPLQSSV